jgi:hypothetical protein
MIGVIVTLSDPDPDVATDSGLPVSLPPILAAVLVDVSIVAVTLFHVADAV